MVRHKHLYDIAGIGPHHDELSVRHIDNTHDAKGDGKANGGKEINRRQ